MSLFGKHANVDSMDNTNSGEKPVDKVSASVQPWEQPQTLNATHAAFGYKSEAGTTLQSSPVGSLENIEDVESKKESIFHPVEMIQDVIKAIDTQTQAINKLLNQMLLERVFQDHYEPIGSTMFYSVDYKDRKYIFMLSGSDIVLNYPSGQIFLQAGVWKNVSLQRGTPLTVNGGSDVSPNVILVRNCDVSMFDFAPQVATFSQNLISYQENGQMFVLTTGAQSGGTQTSVFDMFNPSTNSKTVFVYSIGITNSQSGQGVFTSLRGQTSAGGYTLALTPVNMNPASTNTSNVTSSWQASQSVAGIDIGTISTNSQAFLELLTNGAMIELPPGKGLSVFVGQNGTGGFWSVNVRYVEKV